MNLAARILSALLALITYSTYAATNLVITYKHAGLREIVVSNKQLRSYWVTSRTWETPAIGVIAPIPQSMEAYDKHVDTIWLKWAEFHEFESWSTNFNIFDMPLPLTTSTNQTYSSAFKSSLQVSAGTNIYSTSWNGDSIVPPQLTSAVQTLDELAHRITQSRSRK